MKKALVLRRMLTVLLIDAISEFKAGVSRAVSHTWGVSKCLLQRSSPYGYLNFASSIVFLPIWHPCFPAPQFRLPEEAEEHMWVVHSAKLSPLHIRARFAYVKKSKAELCCARNLCVISA